MKKWWVLLLVAIFPSAFAAADADLQKLLNQYNSYQANFSQVTESGRNHTTQKSQGRVLMQRPGKFRWETTAPYQQTIIANGDTVWVYDVDLAQATQQSLANRGFNPAQLLTEPVADLAAKFTVTQGGDGWFKLVPKQADHGFKAAYLQFQNNRLTGLKIVNQLDQTNTFTFTQVRVNPTLEARLFEFNPPAGVQLLK